MTELTNDTTKLIDPAVEDRYFRACMEYSKLLAITVDQLTEHNFSTPQKAKLFMCLKWYFLEYKEVPSLDILKITVEELYPSEVSGLVIRLIDRIAVLPKPEWGWIVAKLDQYVKTIKLQKALFEAGSLLKNNQYNDAQSRVIDVIRHSGLVTATSPNDLTLSRDDLFKLSQDDEMFCCPTRVYALDSVLKGFYRQELFILMSPLNVGKSFFVVHAAVAALMSGKRVLYFTLEMRKDRVMQRIVQNASGVAKPRHNDELNRMVEVWDDQFQEKLESDERTLLDTARTFKCMETLRKFGGQLSVQEYSSGEATLQDLERDIAVFDVTFGAPPDIIFIDGLLDMKFAGKSEADRNRMGLTDLCRSLRKLGKDYNAAVVVAHQTNREGMSAEVVGAEHAGESLGIMQVADTCVTLNQTKAENAQGKIRLHVARARSAKKWQHVECYQNLDLGQFCLASKIVEAPEKEESEQRPGRPPPRTRRTGNDP